MKNLYYLFFVVFFLVACDYNPENNATANIPLEDNFSAPNQDNTFPSIYGSSADDIPLDGTVISIYFNSDGIRCIQVEVGGVLKDICQTNIIDIDFTDCTKETDPIKRQECTMKQRIKKPETQGDIEISDCIKETEPSKLHECIMKESGNKIATQGE